MPSPSLFPPFPSGTSHVQNGSYVFSTDWVKPSSSSQVNVKVPQYVFEIRHKNDTVVMQITALYSSLHGQPVNEILIPVRLSPVW